MESAGPSATAKTLKTLLLKFVGDSGPGGRGRSEGDNRGERALDDSHCGTTFWIRRCCFRGFLDRVERNKSGQLWQADAAVFCDAASRIAASTGSWPPSELARAAMPRTCASSNPGNGRTLVTVSSLRVRVPVLSEHNTSIDAASSTAESRVGNTPSFAKRTSSNRSSKGECCRQCHGDDGKDRGQQQRNHLAPWHRMVIGISAHRNDDYGN
jgi:cytochrome c553